MPAKCPDRYRYILVREGVKMGSLGGPLTARTKEFTEWLCKQVPRDGEATVVDVLMSIADDEFNRELEMT